MKPLLLRARVMGYRCLADVTFEPADRISVLVGGNATGKSTLLDALQLVADIVRWGQGAFLGERRAALGVSYLRLQDLVTAGQAPALTVELDFNIGGPNLNYAIQLVPTANAYRVERERLIEIADTPRLLAERDPDGARIRRGQGSSSEVVPVGVQSHSSILALGEDGVSYPEVAPTTRYICGFCAFNLSPVLMRTSGVPDTSGPLPDRFGRDLATRLFRLQTVRPRSVPDWLAAIDFLGWSELRTPLLEGRVEPQILEGSSPHPVRLALASDGSLEASYLATLVVDPPEQATLLLIDEPGAAYFPGDVPAVGELLATLGHIRQTVVATHSQGLVQSIGSMDSAWLMERRAGEAATLRRVPKKDDRFADLVAVAGIGEAAFVTARSISRGAEGE